MIVVTKAAPKPAVTVSAPELVDDGQRALIEFNRKPLAQQAMIVANAAYANEKATRARVDELQGAFNALGERDVWGRLSWILRGK